MVTEIRISVRNLVEFLLRSGDLDNRAGAGAEDAMLEGSRMHRQIQKAAGDGYQAEVTLRIPWTYEKRLHGVTGDAADMLEDDSLQDGADETGAPDYANPHAARPYLDDATVMVEGRADGLFYDTKENVWTIDEIKTTYRRLSRLRKPEPVHLAQAKCYAYIYAEQNDLPRVNVRMTYCNLYDGSIRYFHSEHTLEELRTWFAALMEEYRKWAEYTLMWQLRRTASIRDLTFPYPYREGQRRLVSAVYRTIDHGRKLYLEAPTGTGKTIATLYPAVRAMGEGKSSRIFYLTAKTITRTAAEHATQEMREQGLLAKSVSLTARDKICALEHPDCNPRSCPRAKGHYDRINKALFDLLTHKDAYTRENIERYATQYRVCPFELGLDVALFSDVIIGDYNYLFDPHAYLRRFFGENGDKKSDAIFLIDEAHNLVDRGRDMYSASICKEDVLALRKRIKGIYKGLEKRLTSCNRAMLQIKKRMTDDPEETEETAPAAQTTQADPHDQDPGTALAPYVRGALVPTGNRSTTTGPQGTVMRLAEVDQLGSAVYQLQAELGDILTQERILELNGRFRHDPLYKEKLAVREELLQFYFDVNHFLLILQGLDERYILYAELGANGRQIVHLYNADPSANLAHCMERGRASILFSATLLPITYYKSLLGGTNEDYEIYAQSVFDPERRRLLVVRDVSSRYRDRNAATYERIADCIHAITGERHGNYMIFFPSYAFLRQVADVFEVKYLGRDPATLRDLPVPAWKRRSAYMEGAWEAEQAALVPGRRSRAEDGQMSLWDLEYGAGTLPAATPNHSVPGSDITLLRQQANMDEAHREAFLRRFSVVSDEESLLGFCTLGGIFSEGIDLREDALIGALVVGTGIPQVSAERDLLKDYFNERGENGYDYAYTFPGMNKVLQAAGRVIRTQEDVGIIALLDDRFTTPGYRSLFPAEWEDYTVTTSTEAAGIVARFWDEWL